jgi:hypothetical protein
VSTPADQYPYVQMDPSAGAASLSPYLPFTLSIGQRDVSVLGLLDSGAAINVLPYEVGLQLGAVWQDQTTPVQLTGNLAAAEARILVVSASVGKHPAVKLAFAWAKTTSVPIILGQINFFLEFDVCFFRARTTFEVKPRSVSSS